MYEHGIESIYNGDCDTFEDLLLKSSLKYMRYVFLTWTDQKDRDLVYRIFDDFEKIRSSFKQDNLRHLLLLE